MYTPDQPNFLEFAMSRKSVEVAPQRSPWRSLLVCLCLAVSLSVAPGAGASATSSNVSAQCGVALSAQKASVGKLRAEVARLTKEGPTYQGRLTKARNEHAAALNKAKQATTALGKARASTHAARAGAQVFQLEAQIRAWRSLPTLRAQLARAEAALASAQKRCLNRG
jgi:hypothetical protein